MAEPATDAFGGIDLDRVIRGALPQQTVDVPKAQEGLKEVAKEQSKASSDIAGRMSSDVNRDLSRIHKAEQGIEPVPDMKWDADAERKKRTTDPMESFGSLGFIALTTPRALH